MSFLIWWFYYLFLKLNFRKKILKNIQNFELKKSKTFFFRKLSAVTLKAVKNIHNSVSYAFNIYYLSSFAYLFIWIIELEIFSWFTMWNSLKLTYITNMTYLMLLNIFFRLQHLTILNDIVESISKYKSLLVKDSLSYFSFFTKKLFIPSSEIS